MYYRIVMAWSRFLFTLAAPLRLLNTIVMHLTGNTPTEKEMESAGILLGAIIRGAISQCLQEQVIVWIPYCPKEKDPWEITDVSRVHNIVREHRNSLNAVDIDLLRRAQLILGMDDWVEVWDVTWKQILHATHLYFLENQAKTVLQLVEDNE
jgi:hypothetical protein